MSNGEWEYMSIQMHVKTPKELAFLVCKPDVLNLSRLCQAKHWMKKNTCSTRQKIVNPRKGVTHPSAWRTQSLQSCSGLRRTGGRWASAGHHGCNCACAGSSSRLQCHAAFAACVVRCESINLILHFFVDSSMIVLKLSVGLQLCSGMQAFPHYLCNVKHQSIR